MTPDPQEFARAWIADWNRHDVEAVLDHFHDELVFTSPVAREVVPASGGAVRGKAALRDYWTQALVQRPDLHFTLLGITAGLDVLVIRYRNQHGTECCEVLRFDGDRVREGHGTYAPAPPAH